MSELPIPDGPGKPTPSTRGFLHRLQAALAIVIALAAIGLAYWEGIENRRHNRLSVKPRLAAEIESGRDTSGQYVRMAIEGTGLGPAVVNTFRIYFDGVVQDTVSASNNPWEKAIEAFSGTPTQINAHALGNGYYFPAGRRFVLFEARRARASADSTSPPLADIMDRLAFQICYCSIYGTDCDDVLITAATLDPQQCSKEGP